MGGRAERQSQRRTIEIAVRSTELCSQCCAVEYAVRQAFQRTFRLPQRCAKQFAVAVAIKLPERRSQFCAIEVALWVPEFDAIEVAIWGTECGPSAAPSR